MSRPLPDVVAIAATLRKRDASRESRLQAEFVSWIRENVADVLVFAIWNGGD